jgi:hypothetical protein
MLMLLICHIIIALSGLAVAAAGLFVPSNRTLKATHILTGLTIASGTVLVIVSPGHLLQSCLTGLGYLVVMLGMATVIRWRLANGKAG